MSRIPMNPSVACLTALFRIAIDLWLFLDPEVPTVEATVSASLLLFLMTDSLEPELIVAAPPVRPVGLLRLFALRTMVATVRQ